MPRGAKPKSCPAYVFFHGAGVRPAFQPLTWAARGLLAFNVNAHGLYNDLSEADYRALAEGPLKDYAKQPVYSAEDSVFRDMILRVQRALEFMKSLPEWDGRFLIVHGGSQARFRRLAAAALDRDVSFVVAQRSGDVRSGRRAGRADVAVAARDFAGRHGTGCPLLRRRRIRPPDHGSGPLHRRFFGYGVDSVVGLRRFQRVRQLRQGDPELPGLRPRRSGLLDR